MRTSKKLLSFFLAVVMIVTTCSVGFTAFAKDKQNIWSTQCEADDAFNSLNGLIDEFIPGLLMGIDVIGNPYFEKQARAMGKTAADLTDEEKEQIIDNSTLSEILQVLQPLLLNLLSGTSQQDFADKYYPGNDVSKFDYLISDNTMSYFTLVGICDTFSKDKVPSQNGQVSNPLTAEQREQLADWYDLLMPISAKAVAGDDLIKSYAKKYQEEMDCDYDTECLFNLDTFDYQITEEDAVTIEGMYASYNAQLRANGVSEDAVTIDSLGKIIYYFFGVGRSLLTAGKYHELLSSIDVKTTFVGEGDLMGGEDIVSFNITEDITPANYTKVLIPAAYANGLMDYDGNLVAVVDGNGEIDWVKFSKVMLGFGEDEDLPDELMLFVKSVTEDYALDFYLNTVLPSHYNETLAAIAVREGKVSSADEYYSLVEDTFYTGDAHSMSADDLKTMALALQRTYDSGKEANYADSFFSGETTAFSGPGLTYNLTMPEALKGTSAAELFRLTTGYSKNNDYKYALVDAFLPNFTSQVLVVNSSGVLIPGEDGLPQIISHNPDLDTIDRYFDDAEVFAYSWVFTNLTGIEGTVKDDASGQNFIVDVINYAENIPAEVEGSGRTELTDEERAIIAGVDFTGDIGTTILNFKLNDTVINILQMELLGKTVEQLVNSLLITPVSLVDALEDVWSRLVDSPVETIIELVPLLVVLVDELLVPILANGDGDQWNGIVYGVLSTSLLSNISIESGSYIGLSQLDWDLNELLPDIMHWLFDQENASGIEYYAEKDVTFTHFVDTGSESVRMVKEFRMAEVDTSDMKHYTVKDADGNQITRVDNEDGTATFSYKDVTSNSFDDIRNAYPDSVFTYTMHYEGNVPKLTGVYIADKALRGANITGLNKIFTKLIGNETIGNGLGELVTELGTLFTAALDEFMATPELRNAEKHDNIGQLLGTGLNNIFVALPQLFDILENLAAEKYGIAEDEWTYCYEGKIAPAGDYDDLRNKDLEELKSYAVSPDAGKTFGTFARIFVEQWIDAIIGLLNNVIGDSETTSEFTQNLPIISGLLQSLGGFGPESVFTDIFNSIFQLKRGDKYSFEFKPAESTGLVGLSADNAFFLITNVKTLVDVIMDLVGKFGSSDDEETASLNDGMALAEYYSSIRSEQLLAAPYDVPSYTNDELKDINGVITSLDEMLSSLLTDSSINGYGLDTAGNIASGLVSFLSNFITADDATSLLGLINDYLYYLDGAGTRSADENGNMKPEEVYTNDNLSDLIVRTFALIETVLEELLSGFNYADKSYNLIVSAIEGVISPDAIGIRLDDYADAQSKILELSSWNDALDRNVKMDWNVSKGDKDAFFAGLSSALRLVTTILGVVIVDTGWYETIVAPVLEALCKENGVEVKIPDKSSKYHDDVIICLLSSVAGLLDKLLSAPVTTLMNAVKGIAGILDDKSGATIASIVSGAITPLVNELKGVANLLELESIDLGPISPTLKNAVLDLAGKLGKYAETNSDNELVNIQVRNINLCGNNLIDIVNKFIGDAFFNIFNNYDTTIVLQGIDWSVLSKAETPAHVLAYILSYAVDMVADNENLAVILALALKDKEVSDTVNTIIGAIQNGSIDGKAIVTILNKVLKLVNSPGMFAWTFQHYLEEKIENFSYPIGITKSKADEAVTDLDAVIKNIFPVLKSLGIDLGGSDLSGILNSKLFTNELLTKLAVALYGALESNATVAQVLGIIGIPCSTADVAKILMDTSFGATYSAAASAISAKAKWNDLVTIKKETVKDDKGNDVVKETKIYDKLNWGFTDGASNAQQGFVNGLVAILRPLNNVLNVFLNSGSLGIDVDAIFALLGSLSGTEFFVNISSVCARGTLTVSGTSLILDIMPVDADHNEIAGGENSRVVLDLNALNNLAVYGANGYNSAIIPLLEAFGCEGIVNASQYASDVTSAKDNLLLDVLNPILGGNNSLLNKIVAKPIETIATILPNVSMFIDAHGLSQLVAKLLAPVIDVVEEVSSIVDVNTIIAALLGAEEGTSLGDALASLLGLPAGVLKVDLADISSINIEDIIIPLVNSLLKKTGIVLPEINWAVLTQFGTEATYTSLATDVNGNALKGKTLKNVDYGKVLITVLRYVANTLITNGTVIQNLIVSALSKDDAAKAKNATVIGIINNVFGQIKTHTADQIITAIYYFFIGDPTDTLWDYTNYKTVNSTFKMPEGITEDDVNNLIAFIDGIVEEINLNVLLNQYLYTDKIINLIAKGVYVSLGGIKINDSIQVGDILALVGITLDTKSVATLLADKSYGETAQFKSATDTISAAANWSAVDFDSLKWGVKDQKTFLNALVAVLRPLDGLLDALLADGKLNILEGIDIPGSNDYVNAIVPLLEAFKCENIPSYKTYLADKTKAKDALLLDILTPLFGFVDKVVANPIDTLASTLPNVALFISNEGLIQLIMNLITPITAIINDVNPIIDVDALLKDLLKNNTNLKDLSISGLDKFLEKYIGSKNIIPLVNSLLTKTGIVVPDIDWAQLAALGTVSDGKSAVDCKGTRKVVNGDSSKVIIALLNFVLDTVLSNSDAIKNLIGDSYKGTLKDILDMVFNLSAEDVLQLVFKFIGITDLAKGDGKQAYWAYKHYKSVNSKFAYPAGISAQDADNAIEQLDSAVGGVFALLSGLGVVKADDLSGLVGDLLFTNETLTKLAKALYGALDSDKLSPYLTKAGIAVSTKDVAKILTDKSYGKTYSSAAKAIKAAKSWDKVKKVNWGFTDGAKNAEQGFINGLVAVLRPFIDVLGPFLNGSDLALGEIVYGIVCALEINSGDKKKGETLITMKDGRLKIESQSNGVYETVLELNLANLKTLKELNLNGANAYESAIIPLLDVLQVDNKEIKTFKQYVKDCNKAKDNVLLDVLNPLMSFIDRVLDAPFDTITSVLPNLAYFIDNNGIGQLLDNVLSPVTNLLRDFKEEGLDVDKIIKAIAGKDLGKLITDLVGLKGVKLNLQLTDLKSCNIQEIVVPLINKLLKSTGIQLPVFKWSTIASHGKAVTSKSQAKNAEGKYTNKEIIADKGEVLVAVLRYVADTLVKNSKALKNLLCGIDAIKKNDLISSIIKSVFNTIGASDKDDIVRAVFYLLNARPTNAFWDYTAYETGEYTFTYPDSVDTDFLVQLPPMLDGLISGLADLNSLIGGVLFKDELVSKLATGLYGAIEGVKVGDGSLATLLAQTGIDFTSANVANLLTDPAYGKSYDSAASVIKSAGSWKNVNADNLKWGVTDRDSFFHALVAVLRPIFPVLDVLLNDAYLGLFNIVRIPGSNGYTSSIVPLMEAFSMYNIKTQYQYRQDINEEYDNILLDIINPLWDKIEDILNAPLQLVASMLPNLALFIGNDGLCQIIDNLLTPVSALVDAIKPVVNLNDLLGAVLKALKVDLGSLLGKIGVTNFNLDLYDLNATLKPLLGGDAIIPLVNNILGLIKIGGQPLGIKLNDVDWLQLASHGETIVSASQAATYGSRVFVEGDCSETLIAVLRYLIDTVNAGDNFDMISGLIGGLLGDKLSDSIADVIDQVLGMLQGDTDEVIASLVDLLQTLA